MLKTLVLTWLVMYAIVSSMNLAITHNDDFEKHVYAAAQRRKPLMLALSVLDILAVTYAVVYMMNH